MMSTSLNADLDRREGTAALKARELARLSHKEREGVLDDIHGVSSMAVENDVDAKLRAFHVEVQTLVENSMVTSKAYQLAAATKREFTSDQSLALSFLRADCFDASAAARRFLSFFEEKLELFGPDALCRPIRQSDFNQEDRSVLQSGQWQLLNKKDQSGRRILCNIQSHTNYKQPENVVSLMSLQTAVGLYCAAWHRY